MFTPQELEDVHDNYYYNSVKRQVIDKNTQKEVTDKQLLLKVKAALSLIRAMNELAPSQKQSLTIQDIIDAADERILTGEYTIEAQAIKNRTQQLFSQFYDINTEELIKAYISYALQHNGKTADNFTTFSTRVKNTWDPLIRWDVIDRKTKFARELIECYDVTETDALYDQRSREESENMRAVLKAIQNGVMDKPMDNIVNIIKILKAADNLSLPLERDYLDRIVQMPEVEQALRTIRDNGQIKALEAMAKKAMAEGNTKQHSRTNAEKDKEYASNYIVSDKDVAPETTIMRARELIKEKQTIKFQKSEKDNNSFSEVDKGRVGLIRILLRRQGKEPTNAKIVNGNIEFSTDSKDNTTIDI